MKSLIKYEEFILFINKYIFNLLIIQIYYRKIQLFMNNTKCSLGHILL